MAIINEQVIVNCNDVFSRTYTADTDNFFSSILFNGTQLTFSQVSSVSYKGVPITSDPIVPCDTFTTNINVGTTTNQTLAIIQTCDSGETVISFSFRGRGLRQFEHTLTESMPNAVITSLFSLASDYTYEYKATLSGSYTSYTQSQFISVIANGAIGGSIRITYTGSYNIHQLISITYRNNQTQLNPNINTQTLEFGQDDLIAFKDKIQLSNIIAPNASNIFASVRTTNASTSNWAGFAHDILTGGGLTGVNTDLATATPPYALHFFQNYSGVSNNSGVITAKAEYQSETGKLRKVINKGYKDDFDFRFFGQSLFNDGINDFIALPNSMPNPFAVGNPATSPLVTFNTDKSFCLSGWFFYDTTGTGRCFVLDAKEWQSNASYGYSFFTILNNLCYIEYADSIFKTIMQVSIKLIPNKWNHFIISQTGNVSANSVSGVCYINGRKYNLITSLTNGGVGSGSLPSNRFPVVYNAINAFANLGVQNSLNSYVKNRLADIMFFTGTITDEQAVLLFNRGTNVAANYATDYPTSILNNRFIHYSLDTGNYTNNTPVGKARVNDLSSVGINGTIEGQGSSPTLVNFY